MLDGTERPIQRSRNPEKQQQNYSGKKKRHTRSHLGAVDPDKRILVLSEAYAGKAHDKGTFLAKLQSRPIQGFKVCKRSM